MKYDTVYESSENRLHVIVILVFIFFFFRLSYFKIVSSFMLNLSVCRFMLIIYNDHLHFIVNWLLYVLFSCYILYAPIKNF